MLFISISNNKSEVITRTTEGIFSVLTNVAPYYLPLPHYNLPLLHQTTYHCDTIPLTIVTSYHLPWWHHTTYHCCIILLTIVTPDHLLLRHYTTYHCDTITLTTVTPYHLPLLHHTTYHCYTCLLFLSPSCRKDFGKLCIPCCMVHPCVLYKIWSVI